MAYPCVSHAIRRDLKAITKARKCRNTENYANNYENYSYNPTNYGLSRVVDRDTEQLRQTSETETCDSQYPALQKLMSTWRCR